MRKVNGIRCLKCLDEIWSRYGHDFRYCKCGHCFIDGGQEYVRFGYETDKPEQIIIETEEPEVIRKSRFPY